MPSLTLITQLPGHSEPAWSVAFNPTRPILASCSTDKTIRFYSYSLPSISSSNQIEIDHPPASFTSRPTSDSTTQPPTFKFLQEISSGHKRTIRSLAWSPSGKTLASGSFDSTVSIWEEGGESSASAVEGIDGPSSSSHDRDPEDEDDGDADEDSGKKEWECLTTLEGHDSECKSVGYSSDGALLASCSRDKSVWIWEVQPDSDFECISVMMEHTQDVKTLTWHPIEEILASASYDASILLFADDPDADWGPFQKLLPSNSTARDPSPYTGTSSSSSSTSITKAIGTGSFEIPPLKDPETIWSLAFSPDGMYLASGGDGGGIRIWARGGTSGEARWTEISHTKAHDQRACFSLSWSEGGSSEGDNGLGLLASGGGDNRICIWQVTKSTETKTPVGSKPIPVDITLSPASIIPRAHGIYDINCISWCKRTIQESSSGAIKAKEEKIKKQTEHVLASCADDGTVRVWQYQG